VSLIIYKDGVLGADRCGVVQPYTTYSNLQEMRKLYVCKTKRMAVAFCGDNIHPESVQIAMDIFSIVLMGWEAAEKNVGPEFTEEQREAFLGDRTYFVMTTTDAWCVDGYRWTHLNETTQCRGNGAWMGYVGLAHGLSVTDTIISVGELNPEVGTVVDVIGQSDLLPLITPPAKPAPVEVAPTRKRARKPRVPRIAK